MKITNHIRSSTNMKQLNLLPISIQRILEQCDVECHIDEDVVITRLESTPLPSDNRHMRCTLVVLCTSGEASYTIGTIEHSVKANDVIIVGEGQVLGDIRVRKKMKGEMILISHDFLYDVIRNVRDVTNLFVFSREHPVLSLTSEEVAMFRDYVRVLMLKVGDDSHTFRRQITGTILATMIYDLCNVTRRMVSMLPQSQSRAQEMFEKYITLVERNFRHNRNVGWYSGRMGITPKTLLETVKRVSNRTPNEWLDIYTTLELRLLLKNTTKSIKEISDELHFGNQSSMGKFFREHVGMSPTAYRQSTES